MKLFQRLYNAVWLATFSCLLVPRWMGKWGAPVHVLLGVLMLVVALANARALAALAVPERLKRISKTTAGLAIFQLVVGLAFGAVKHMWPDVPVLLSALNGTHVFVALAILAQTASVATGYDMWEEKEFGPAPAPPAPKA